MELLRYDARILPRGQPFSPTKLCVQIPRTYFELGSVLYDSDTSESSEGESPIQYVLSEKATIRESVDLKEDLTGQSPTLPLHQMVLQIPEEYDCDYWYSLYPGSRSSTLPGSVTAIVCNHAGLSPRILQNTANVWGRASSETRQIHVALLGKDFGLVLPAVVECGNTSMLTKGSPSMTFGNSGSKGGRKRSDFEASAFMALMPDRGTIKYICLSGNIANANF